MRVYVCVCVFVCVCVSVYVCVRVMSVSVCSLIPAMTIGNAFSYVLQFPSGTRKLEYSYCGCKSMPDQSRVGTDVPLYDISATHRLSQRESSLQL